MRGRNWLPASPALGRTIPHASRWLSAFPAHHMKCRGATWRGDDRVLLPVALYRLIGGFSGVTPHNHVDRVAGSDQRIYTFAKPRDDLLGGHLPPPNQKHQRNWWSSAKTEWN